KSATQVSQYPLPTLPEIAFAGRSNVGKSSLINALLGRKNLAKTSNTPGRTQLINFFTINDKMSFVDLPGYGFAKVARSVKENWGEMIEAYLRQRTNLALVVLILDIRRVPNEDDLSLRDWLDHYRIPYLYVLTKSDKLSNNQSVKQKQIIEKILNVSKEEKLILFSAKTQKGKDDLWKILEKYSNNPTDVICQ
ncbi:MAG TPA: ribosome biogenesis GTP-binding protein YihA/YsxC, partial [Smithellaceae bacterium]|nr:ribosome biogenesis GTP-binding protein YihA/YsxC [Smithellaceae bacterium]HPM71225.1 ribosome biogenesis GTP-binding protein YihA/YsxC [Smithellaceae bacterium]HQM44080.1 ribosome biogenesis GTP-binding protein YihA/YsxC [Smithellaceae bacterium]